MTGPDDATREQDVVEQPSVSTAPPPAQAHRWWSTIPSHLGRARTSTVVLAVLFVAVFALYLNVRPDPTGSATTGDDTSVTEPGPATTDTPTPTPTEPAPTTETDPTTTDVPTTAPTTTSDATVPEGTTTDVPTTEPVPVPTNAPPTG